MADLGPRPGTPDPGPRPRGLGALLVQQEQVKSYTEGTELLSHEAAPGPTARAPRVTSRNPDGGPAVTPVYRGDTKDALGPLGCSVVGLPGRAGTQTGWGQRFLGSRPRRLRAPASSRPQVTLCPALLPCKGPPVALRVEAVYDPLLLQAERGGSCPLVLGRRLRHDTQGALPRAGNVLGVNHGAIRENHVRS